MLLLIGVLIGLIVGTLNKGEIIRLCTLSCLWLPILAFTAGPALRLFPQMQFWVKATVLTSSYLCNSLFIFANRRYIAPAVLLGLGSLSNYIVIAANSFRMPVSAEALSVYSGMTAQAVITKRPDYFIAVDGTRMLFMGDVIYIPIPVLSGFISIGDILLSMGILLLIVFAMTDKNAEIKSKTLT